MKLLVMVIVVIGMISESHAHTLAETNEVVRLILDQVVGVARDTPDYERGGLVSSHVSWSSFLGQNDASGWSFEEKKNAFRWYLSTLGTTDCTRFTVEEKCRVRVALSRCRSMKLTESVLSLKALALNPMGICRAKAAELVLDFCQTGNELTEFVEAIVTNAVSYSLEERSSIWCSYVDKLLLETTSGTNGAMVVSNAVDMIYRNRLQRCGLTKITDHLFVERYVGYSSSSNRLDFALRVLADPECCEYDRTEFIAITNQLLSSGQPLQWINVGGNNP